MAHLVYSGNRWAAGCSGRLDDTLNGTAEADAIRGGDGDESIGNEDDDDDEIVSWATGDRLAFWQIQEDEIDVDAEDGFTVFSWSGGSVMVDSVGLVQGADYFIL